MNHPFEVRNFERNRTDFLRASLGGDATWGDLENWRIPTLAQYVQLDAIATQIGRGDAREGLRELGLISRTDPRALPGFTYQGARYRETTLRRRNGGLSGGRRSVSQIELDVYIFSRPGRAGHSYRLVYNREDSGPPYLGAMFVRGSLSGSRQRQYDTIFATGTTVRPRVELAVSQDRMRAVANYQFETGQQFFLDVTSRAAWQSSDPTIMEVSNYSDEVASGTKSLPWGGLTYTRAGRCDISASLVVDSSRLLTPAGYATGTLSQNSTLDVLAVHQVMITPRNVIFTSAADTPAFFYCTGFSRQASQVDRETHVATDFTNSERVSWSLLGPDGQPVPPDRAEVSTRSTSSSNPVPLGGVLRIQDPTLPNGIYRVRASLSRGVGGVDTTDETQILLQLR